MFRVLFIIDYLKSGKSQNQIVPSKIKFKWNQFEESIHIDNYLQSNPKYINVYLKIKPFQLKRSKKFNLLFYQKIAEKKSNPTISRISIVTEKKREIITKKKSSPKSLQTSQFTLYMNNFF